MRNILLYILVIGTGVVFTARLLYLQAIKTSLRDLADMNAISIVYDYPQRGYIFDRNKELLVVNQPAYDIMVIPKNIKNLDTLALGEVLNISKESLKNILIKASAYPNSPRVPSVVIPQLNKEDYAAIQEKMHLFPGFYVQKRSLREYQVQN